MQSRSHIATMAYSLEMTKRKFHRILDSMANSSALSLPADSHNSDVVLPPSKRLRLARPHNAALPSSTRTSLDRSRVLRLNSQSAASRSGASSSPAVMNNPAHCRPWDREQFLARLKSFSGRVDLWAPKPDSINEVAWAKRGWALVERETVRCAACQRRQLIDLKITRAETGESGEDDEEWRKEVLGELAKKYEQIIVERHGPECFWRTNSCDGESGHLAHEQCANYHVEAIQRLPLVRPKISILDLGARYESILKMSSSVPPLVKLPDGLDLDDLFTQFTTCLAHFKPAASIETRSDTANDPSTSVSESVKQKALAIALFGWRGDQSISIMGSDILRCDACFRRLGLWMWQKRPAPADGPVDDYCRIFEGHGEHLRYCPWVNAATQNAGRAPADDPQERLAGWPTLAKLVAATARSLRPPEPRPQPREEPGTPDAAAETEASETPAERDAKGKEKLARWKRLRKAFSFQKLRKSGKENNESHKG